MDESINQIYLTFAKYGKPKEFPACECCLSVAEQRLLLEVKLRELGAAQLSGYAADVFLTVGSLADFKYFLPRILELSVKQEFLWPDPEVVFGKLQLADWDSWPEQERNPILELMRNKFEAVIQNPGSYGSDIDQWVCALGRCVADVTPYLNPLLQPANEDKLLAFIESNPLAFTRNMLDNPFWDSAPANYQRVLAWLNQKQVKALLSERYGMIF